jgi:hypothetical protein
LFATYAIVLFGPAQALVATFEMPMTVTGSTGRFDGAAGSIGGTGTFAQGPHVGSATMTGRIAAPGRHD